jgi:hypothetical protein
VKKEEPTMYEELIKALRDSNCATYGMCGMCPKREKPCIYRYASEAADAIEELSKLHEQPINKLNKEA